MSTKSENPGPGEEKTAQQHAKDKPLDKEIHDLISEAVGPTWEKLDITTAVVIAKVPNSDKVSIYYRGHFYDVATLVSQISRRFSDQIDRDLGR